MEPKVAEACDFVGGGGKRAGIARLEDAASIRNGMAGTHVTRQVI